MEICFKEIKGRHVLAKTSYSQGDTLFEEESFCHVLTSLTSKNTNICSNCLQSKLSITKTCLGCDDIYCSDKCKLISWKTHHWFECFLKNYLESVDVFNRLSLRILLTAAYNLTTVNKHGRVAFTSDLETIQTFNMIISEHNSDKAIVNDHCKDNISYQTYTNKYQTIFSFLTHQSERIMKKNLQQLQPKTNEFVEILSNVLSYTVHDIIDSSDKQYIHLNNLFAKLSFKSYFTNPNFDIRLWKTHIENICYKKHTLNYTTNNFNTIKKTLKFLLQHHIQQLFTYCQAIYHVMDKEQLNGSRVQNLEQERLASAVFLKLPFLNHSCNPNTTIAFEGNKIIVRASRNIMKGEEINHCYGPNFSRHSYEERQSLLLENYFFNCACNICITEKEGGDSLFQLQFRAFKCSSCENPVKIISASNNGVCINVECNKMVSLKEAMEAYLQSQELYNTATKLINKEQYDSAISLLLKCLQIRKDVLYQNHLSIGEIYDEIAKCYVSQNEYSKSIGFLCKSITIVGMCFGLKSLDLAYELKKLAAVYVNIGNIDVAASTAQKALNIFKLHYSPKDNNITDLVKILEAANLKV